MHKSARNSARNDDRPAMSPALPSALAALPNEMARRIELLQHRVHDEDTLLDLMFRIAAEAIRTIPDTKWAGVTAQLDSGPFTMAHTHQRTLIVDERQYRSGDGPCLLALHTRSRQLMSLKQVLLRWPTLGATAEKLNVQTFLAEPAPAFEVIPAAALNLYSDKPGAFQPVDVNTLTVLTQYLSRGVTEYITAQGIPGSTVKFRPALEQRRVITVAVGIMMQLNPALSTLHAREHLYQQANAHTASVVQEAEDVIAAHSPRAWQRGHHHG